jgi:hypothetical protein
MEAMTGKKFEALIKDSCEKQGLSYTRLKDAGWQGEQTERRFTSRNDCDCIIFDGQTLLFAEAKHRKDRVEFSGLTQLDDLIKKQGKCELKNVRYGFIFCIAGQFFYCDIITLAVKRETSAKKSFNAPDAAGFCVPIATYLPKRARTERLDIYGLMSKIVCG